MKHFKSAKPVYSLQRSVKINPVEINGVDLNSCKNPQNAILIIRFRGLFLWSRGTHGPQITIFKTMPYPISLIFLNSLRNFMQNLPLSRSEVWRTYLGGPLDYGANRVSFVNSWSAEKAQVHAG